MSTPSRLLPLLQRGPQPTLTLAQTLGWSVGRVEREMEALVAQGLVHKGEWAWYLGPDPCCPCAPSSRCSIALQNTPRGCPRAGVCAQGWGRSSRSKPRADRGKVLRLLEGGPRTAGSLRDEVGGAAERMKALLSSLAQEGLVVADEPLGASRVVFYRLPHHAPPVQPLGTPETLRQAARQRSVSMRAASKARLLREMEAGRGALTVFEWAAHAKAGREAAEAALEELVAEGLVRTGLRRRPRGRPVRVYRHVSVEPPEPTPPEPTPPKHAPSKQPAPIVGSLAEALQRGPRRSADCDQRELMALVSARKASVYAGWAYLSHDPDLAPVLTEKIGEREVRFRPVRGGLEILEPACKRGVIVHSRAGLSVELGGGSWRDVRCGRAQAAEAGQ